MAVTKGLLTGMKVLDMTRVLAGPYCGMMLADMGADVIKVENPKTGDDARMNAPVVKGESAYFMNLNRNKRGITLNLKNPKGKEIFLELVKQSDVVLENYRPGVMEKLGLGYEDLRKVNPRIIYGAVSGFGHYGPYSQRAGYDIIGQAMSGLMSTTGWPGGEPTRTGTAMSDVLGGLSCTIGVLAAYTNMLKTGIGDKVDISLVDATVSSLEIINMIYLCTGRTPERIGNRYEAVYPYDTFPTKDGMMVIGAGNQKLFEGLCDVMGNEEIKKDPLFGNNILRVQNHAALKPHISAWTKERHLDETVQLLLDAGIPAAPINTIDRVVKDPHIAGAREMFPPCTHPIAGEIRVTGNQIKLTNNKIDTFEPSPLLGQHNSEIIGTLMGLSDEELAKLKEEKAI